MNTTQMMDTALKLSGLGEIPVDSGISVPGEGIRRVLMGVDMDTAELLLARDLGFDCVVAHHPRINTPDYMEIMNHHVDKLAECGVPYNKAYKIVRARKKNLSIGWHTANHARVASAAKLMNMPFLSIHTPADLITEKFVQDYLDERFKDKPRTPLKDIVDALGEIHEFKESVKKPEIRVGDGECFAGKVYVSMSGGTNLDNEGLKAYFDAGIGTIVQMHITEPDVKAAAEWKTGNIIVTCHNASDSIGMNRIADAWEQQGVEVTAMSGYIR